MGATIVNRIEVSAVNLRNALEVAVSEKKSTIPVLTHVLLKPTESGIRVISTDLELAALTDITGKSENSESILIPFRKVLDLLKGESGPAVFTYQETIETVTLRKHGEYKDGVWTEGEEYEQEVKSHALTLEVGAVAYELSSLDRANFPQTPETEAPQFYIPGPEFKAILSRTVFAISREETRYTLNGMLLKAAQSQLIFVATDGHRMAMERMEVDGIKPFDTIICTPALAWLRKNLDKMDAGVHVGEEYTTFSLPNIQTVLIAHRVKGQFPNYEAVMPRKDAAQHIAIFPTGDGLSKVLTKVSQMADERSGAVKWRLNGTCELSAQSSDTGKALATVDASITHTEETEVPVEVSIGLASNLILDFLKVAGKNPVTMNVKDGQSAALLEVPAFPGYSYVLMPMRI